MTKNEIIQSIIQTAELEEQRTSSLHALRIIQKVNNRMMAQTKEWLVKAYETVNDKQSARFTLSVATGILFK